MRERRPSSTSFCAYVVCCKNITVDNRNSSMFSLSCRLIGLICVRWRNFSYFGECVDVVVYILGGRCDRLRIAVRDTSPADVFVCCRETVLYRV